MISLDWELTWREGEESEYHEWVVASVPGAVQRDWGRAHGLPDPHEADYPGPYDWMEDVWWVYRASLPELEAGEWNTIRFRAGGIDYRHAIFRSGECLLRGEGMFSPVVLDLGARTEAGEILEVRIAPVPKTPDSPSRRQARNSCKPAMNYGWDWHPRLVPTGIWQPCGVAIEPACRFQNLEVVAALTEDRSAGRVEVGVHAPRGEGTEVRCTLLAPDGAETAAAETGLANESTAQSLTLEVDGPVLWWPAGHGEAALYTLMVRQVGAAGNTLHEESRRIGFRGIELVMNEGAWDEPVLFPKSRSVAPATLEVNGRKIFAKGTNWVPPRLFPGEISGEDIRELVMLAKDAHFNTLRVWGGGIVNPPAFFEACDEAGMMVIQEFPLACNNYPDDPEYLAVLDRESRSIIRRLRHHASLALWSGGNELFNVWSGMTDQSHALRLLNRNTFELDRSRPFLPTMPVVGMGHGPYTYFDKERHWEIPRIMRESACTAYTEFGQPGPAPVECLERMIPEEERWPPRAGTRWETHHAIGAWLPESWLCLNIHEHIFGPAPDLETLVRRGQWLQSFGYRTIYEEARRQWPACSMALNWCFNEVWPCAANNSLLAWPAIPKPAYHAVKESCRPVLVSAAIEKFRWNPGETFHAALWLLNDSPDGVGGGAVEVLLEHGDEAMTLGIWQIPECGPLANVRGPDMRGELPAHWSGESFKLHIAGRHPGAGHCYEVKLGGPVAPLVFAEDEEEDEDEARLNH